MQPGRRKKMVWVRFWLWFWLGSGSGYGMDGWVICGCFVVCLFVVLYPASLLVVFTKLFVR